MQYALEIYLITIAARFWEEGTFFLAQQYDSIFITTMLKSIFDCIWLQAVKDFYYLH